MKNIIKLSTVAIITSPLATVVACGSAIDNTLDWGQPGEFAKIYESYDSSVRLSETENVSNLLTNERKGSESMYQMTVYSFADGNGDGIGDFIGAKNKIPYLNDLGIDQLWLSPIHPATSYHGYDVIDFMDVAPEFGGEEAFDEFLEAAHENGIRVYLDMVFNHTSYEHPWFQDALYNEGYEDYYNFYDPSVPKSDLNSDSQEHRDYAFNVDQTKPATDKAFISKFWTGMPDLNLDNPKVIDEIRNIIQYWSLKGVDGYRLDAIDEFYSSQGETNNNFTITDVLWNIQDSAQVGRKLGGHPNSEDSFIFGENWSGMTGFLDRLQTDTGERAMDSAYDSTHFKNSNTLIWDVDAINVNLEAYEVANDRSIWLPFLGNHDEERWLHKWRKNSRGLLVQDHSSPLDEIDEAAIEMAMFRIQTMPATPIIYQGDELGYHGSKAFGDPGLREPMKWSDSKSITGFEQYSNGDKIFLNYSDDRDAAETQVKNEEGAVNNLSELNKFRIENPWFGMTSKDTLKRANEYYDDQYDRIYIRQNLDGSEKYLIMFNPSVRNELEWPVLNGHDLSGNEAIFSKDVEVTNSTITVGKLGYAMIKL